MVRKLASPILSGLLLAAPCAAIMSTVAAFLFLVSSTVVRDLYQRTLNPGASEKSIRILTYSTTGGLGFLVAALAIFTPDFLQ
jgi:sodium/pantothenate symporter